MVKQFFPGTLILLMLFFANPLSAQEPLPEPWVSYPTANSEAYGVYHFRKTFELSVPPEELIVHVSADNRYELFVNGERVCFGPAKGDLMTYKYDVIDIAAYLQAGENVLAALVFNMGAEKPMAFISAQTAFLLRAASENYAYLNSDRDWKTYENPAYDPIGYRELNTRAWVRGYYACGPGDEVFADRYPWGWESPGFDDGSWVAPQVLTFERRPPWNLVPRNIAFMDTHTERPAAIRRSEGVAGVSDFLRSEQRIRVAANTTAKVLFDYGIFTMGYPEITVTGGKDARITARYAEALYEQPDLKAHRDSVGTLTMYGVFDIYHTDGEQRTFRPLWKRAYRYLELEIETSGEPLELLRLESTYSGYPYPEMGTFVSDDARLNEIFETGLRTLRMCSGETFYDTPFYEQLSYGGDNRPISGIYLYNTTDDRLLREVFRLLPQSANIETNLFKSAYPSRFNFDMGTWSMAWIQGLWDYYQVRGDTAFLQQFIAPIEGVLEFHLYHLDESTGLLGPIHTRNFIDWSIHEGSVPQKRPRIVISQSAMLSLYFVHTLDCTARLYRQLGETAKATRWEALSARIKTAVYAHCWDEDKQLMADYPDKQQFSQHTNILAILCDAVAPAAQSALLDKILTYEHFDEVASSYFSFFLFKAMEKTGREELFLEHLDFWNTFLERGHTTFGETGFASHDRSDCHAWSAHPSYFLLSLVAGVKPADIGFRTVEIKPHLGDLKDLEISMPHPLGRIKINYRVRDDQLEANIELPPGLNGTFAYGGQELPVRSGVNRLEVNR
ncbi:alpha-L-rhamnosidase-related protein [Flavilitoribacter nigricans]|uniref:Alpha-L-rhamnosidase n=1 Tax=Flavilitoribacter nigricans (strain ATCC 23147 / DSM 23189 / NBRC 102662 / NCIMB 1420 / SS-2) TaxID=1122177 RepID=A0A2D0NC38_FLAN2|nr:family 78 glycoside hydrolase catalytic domain [Flavilitoribacter nigricans]PHN06074.1 hypothetical protein CRP01_13980 [Flavilitoribacter nigricans DSM 23189 = NBRC 102662]